MQIQWRYFNSSNNVNLLLLFMFFLRSLSIGSLLLGFTNKSSMHGTGQLFFFYDLFRLDHMYLFKTFSFLGKKNPRVAQ